MAISKSLHCSCLHALNLPHHAWDWYGAHTDHLPYDPPGVGMSGASVYSLSTLLFFFLSVTEGKIQSIVSIQNNDKAQQGLRAAFCRYIQIQAQQNSLSSRLVIPIMRGSVFRKGVSCFESTVFYMERALCILFFAQGDRGSSMVRTKPKELL